MRPLCQPSGKSFCQQKKVIEKPNNSNDDDANKNYRMRFASRGKIHILRAVDTRPTTTSEQCEKKKKTNEKKKKTDNERDSDSKFQRVQRADPDTPAHTVLIVIRKIHLF